MSKTILVVDDSATMLMSLKSTLELAGFAVDTASDGVKAVDRLRTGRKPDLIITDVNMPNMDGMQLIQQVRTMPGFRFTPILTLTTETQADKRAEGKRLGATGWMVKPVGGADLLKVIKQVLPGA
jgi:two-component system chemotaxis response regulator CheY